MGVGSFPGSNTREESIIPVAKCLVMLLKCHFRLKTGGIQIQYPTRVPTRPANDSQADGSC